MCSSNELSYADKFELYKTKYSKYIYPKLDLKAIYELDPTADKSIIEDVYHKLNREKLLEDA